jgi:uncharacterized protein
VSAEPDRPHLPTPAQIEAYGNGGFRFGGMSHRGSLLCLPDGIWAWPVAAPEDITAQSLALVLDRPDRVDFFLLGTGRELRPVPEPLRQCFRAAGVTLEAMSTGNAARTWNVLLPERRRVGAGLVAVD